MVGAEVPLRHRVARYVEALRALGALKRALADDGPTPGRLAALQDATAAVRHARAALRGGEIQRAERIAAGGGAA
jgi:hypothetical protein